MRFRSKNDTRLEQKPVAALIDIVFLLLIFFMLTWKSIGLEGQHLFQMANAQPGPGTVTTELDLRVRLISDRNGELENVRFGSRSLGGGEDALIDLGLAVRAVVLDSNGRIIHQGIEITVEPDARLNLQHTIRAMGVCRGEIRRDGSFRSYGTEVKLAAKRVAS